MPIRAQPPLVVNLREETLLRFERRDRVQVVGHDPRVREVMDGRHEVAEEYEETTSAVIYAHRDVVECVPRRREDPDSTTALRRPSGSTSAGRLL